MANVQVTFEFNYVLCLRHGEPFREKWPKGYAVFGLKGFELLLAQKDFQKEAGGKSEAIQELIKKRPICCRLTKENLRRMYEECKVGHLDRCVLCGRTELGTAYRVNVHNSIMGIVLPSEKMYRHVCFDCVIKDPRLGAIVQ